VAKLLAGNGRLNRTHWANIEAKKRGGTATNLAPGVVLRDQGLKFVELGQARIPQCIAWLWYCYLVQTTFHKHESPMEKLLLTLKEH
jgi:hypothetical protein